jgi:hypothetical protein
MKRRNRINGQWSPRLIEMLESPAYRALSASAHRAMSRIEIELGSHGGNDNGRLPVTKQDFLEYGISHDQIAPAIRELEALGFIRVTEHGRGGNAEYRKPNLFFLTFAHGRDSRELGRHMTGEGSKRCKRLNPSLEPHAQTRTPMRSGSACGAQKKTETGPGNQDRHRSRNPGPKQATRRSWIPGLQGQSGNQDHILYLGQGSAANRVWTGEVMTLAR